MDAKIPMELVCKGKDSYGMLSTVPAIQRIGKEKILCEQHSSKNPIIQRRPYSFFPLRDRCAC